MFSWLYHNTQDWRHHNPQAWPEFYHRANQTWLKPKNIMKLESVIRQPEAYIDSSTAEARLKDLIETVSVVNPVHPFDYEYRNKVEQDISGGPVVNQDLCRDQIKWILNAIQLNPNFRTQRGRLGHDLTRLVDAFGKPQAGTFTDGAVYWIPPEEYCLGTVLNEGEIKTRQCIGRFKFYLWPEELVFPANINVGLCIPETCDTNSFNIVGREIEKLAKIDFPEYYRNSLYLSSGFCQPDPRSDLRTFSLEAKIYIFIVGSWLVLVITATILHEFHLRETVTSENFALNSNEKQNEQANGKIIAVKGSTWIVRIAEVFSLRQSFKLLFTSREEKHPRVELSIFDSIKSLMILTVLFSHSFAGPPFLSRALKRELMMNVQPHSWYLIMMAKVNDVFFILFGVLNTMNLLKRFSVKQLGSPWIWLKYNLEVTLKITPLMMLIFFMNQKIVPLLSSGPWWDHGVSRHGRRTCIESSWWHSIPHFGLYNMTPLRICNPPSWFLTSYFQLTLVLPLVVYILSRISNVKERIAFTGFIVFVSGLNTIARFWIQDVVNFDKVNEFGCLIVGVIDKYESTGYFDALTRLGSAIVGCLLGQTLYEYRKGTLTSLPSILLRPATIWLAFIGLMAVSLSPVISHHLYLLGNARESDGPLPQWFSVMMMGILHMAYPIFGAILLLAATTIHKGHPVLRVLRHRIWEVINKIGLITFLIHWEIFIFTSTHQAGGPVFGTLFELLLNAVFTYVISSFLAVFIYVLFQAPVERAAKNILC